MTSLRNFSGYQLTRALDLLRRHSRRAVSMPPADGIGVGNMFSFWLWAHHGRATGHDWWVRRTDAMNPWVEVFPDIQPLLIEPEDLRILDRRDPHWYQDFDRFPVEHLRSFVRERLLTSPVLALTPDGPATTVTVNVRRGDYYSDPVLRRQYGFDIAGFVATAIEGSAAQHPISEIAVVSDDPGWCRDNLGFLADHGTLHFQADDDGPVDNLRQLASARRLILANSSFSYWAAYMSNGLYGDNHALVWAPEFHRRDINDSKAFQLDPTWSIVRDVPGGWGSGI
ncbi:alpha-1,2-fucosyltransferase [Rudaeicoccus suwonensis]|nr:alpha-1,2-fucosyltransferase [Rudaeicoccus suwonensis]